MAHKDVALILIYNAIVFTAFNTVTSSTPYLFGKIYHLDELKIGICYIPFGVASFLAPLLSGRLLDWNFQRVALKAGISIEKKHAQSMADFPFEKARLIIALPLAILGAAALLCYGWVLEVDGPLAAALVLHFVIGLSVTGAFQVMNVVIVDYRKSLPQVNSIPERKQLIQQTHHRSDESGNCCCCKQCHQMLDRRSS